MPVSPDRDRPGADPDLPAALIVTLVLDPPTQARFDILRSAHFPAERNHLDAHLTLFHALPGRLLTRVEDVLRASADRAPVALQAAALRNLGRGVAFVLESEDLQRLRGSIADAFADCLTPQDAQPFRPHVTVQNKVAPADARALLDELARDFRPFPCRGEALALWHYAGGPWRAANRFAFGRDRAGTDA